MHQKTFITFQASQCFMNWSNSIVLMHAFIHTFFYKNSLEKSGLLLLCQDFCIIWQILIPQWPVYIHWKKKRHLLAMSRSKCTTTKVRLVVADTLLFQGFSHFPKKKDTILTSCILYSNIQKTYFSKENKTEKLSEEGICLQFHDQNIQ